jgi:predicted SAM-dependent methyltransferase
MSEPTKSDDDIISEYISSHQRRRLHLGAGRMYMKGWLNTDLSGNGLNFAKIDVTKPFPLPDSCIDFIYTEHMVEHLEYKFFVHMLSECRRVMRTEGVIRIVTPSLLFLISLMQEPSIPINRRYIDWAIEKFSAFAPTNFPGFVLNNFVRAWSHKFIYDPDTLSTTLRIAGFRDLVECKLGESEHPDLTGLEKVHRLPEGFLELESMIIEACK